MSERVGSVRDARFLSGADIGRTITYPDGRAATIHGIEHHLGIVVILEHPQHNHTTILDSHDAVTITGADGPAVGG